MTNPYSYSDADKRAVYRAMAQRRDMRHFISQPIDADTLQNILGAAHLAPSVGLMQPWRFIRISDVAIRRQIHGLVEQERQLTADVLGERKAEFLRLKVEGIMQCAELLVAALPDQREQHVFGRRTLPEMDLASLSCAIQNMWLAARVEGVGMGWVSMFDPEQLKEVLDMPADSKPVALLCIGHVDAFYDKPMLVEEEWAVERPLSEMLYENRWGEAQSHAVPPVEPC